MKRRTEIIRMRDAPSLPALFSERVARTPNAVAYRQWEGEHWQEYSWQDTAREAGRWQAALQRDGLKRGDRVAIMCSNRWEWVVMDQAAQGLGLVVVPIYTNDRAQNLNWILHDSGASLLLVETRRQWRSFNTIRPEIDKLKRVVSLESLPEPTANVQRLEDWLADCSGEYRMDEPDPKQVASIIYTSGTTGNPKGVMLSHTNVIWNLSASLQAVPVYTDDHFLSFLPMSHTLERTIGYYLPMAAGARVTFTRGIPQLLDDLMEVRPSLVIAVPRLFERIHDKLQEKLQESSWLKRRLFDLTVSIGWQRFQRQQKRAGWSPIQQLHPLFDRLLGRLVCNRFGGNLRFAVCGGAALNPEVSRTFIGLGLPIIQGYGLTETSPVISVNRLGDNQPSSVGWPLPGVEMRIGDNDELLTRSPAVMLGYWNNPWATQTIMDEEGWLRTGDQVRIESGGHITITGRLKEIIVLSNGEKVPPGDMENAIAKDELVDQVLVIGEGRPYLSAIVSPNDKALKRLAEELHLDPDEDRIHNPEVVAEYMRHVNRRTDRFPGYARVRHLALVDEHWTPDNGLMTPTLELRRGEILEHYHAIEEELYAGH